MTINVFGILLFSARHRIWYSMRRSVKGANKLFCHEHQATWQGRVILKRIRYSLGGNEYGTALINWFKTIHSFFENWVIFLSTFSFTISVKISLSRRQKWSSEFERKFFGIRWINYLNHWPACHMWKNDLHLSKNEWLTAASISRTRAFNTGFKWIKVLMFMCTHC